MILKLLFLAVLQREYETGINGAIVALSKARMQLCLILRTPKVCTTSTYWITTIGMMHWVKKTHKNRWIEVRLVTLVQFMTSETTCLQQKSLSHFPCMHSIHYRTHQGINCSNKFIDSVQHIGCDGTGTISWQLRSKLIDNWWPVGSLMMSSRRKGRRHITRSQQPRRERHLWH